MALLMFSLIWFSFPRHVILNKLFLLAMWKGGEHHQHNTTTSQNSESIPGMIFLQKLILFVVCVVLLLFDCWAAFVCGMVLLLPLLPLLLLLLLRLVLLLQHNSIKHICIHTRHDLFAKALSLSGVCCVLCCLTAGLLLF